MKSCDKSISSLPVKEGWSWPHLLKKTDQTQEIWLERILTNMFFPLNDPLNPILNIYFEGFVSSTDCKQTDSNHYYRCFYYNYSIYYTIR